jgi:hypothetical protein
MAVFTIMRIYEIPADTRIAATERMLEALELHTEKDYHVTDIVRNKDDMSADRHWKPVECHTQPTWLPFSGGKLPVNGRDCRDT